MANHDDVNDDDDFEPLVGGSGNAKRRQQQSSGSGSSSSPSKEKQQKHNAAAAATSTLLRRHVKWIVPLIVVSVIVLYKRVTSLHPESSIGSPFMKGRNYCKKTCQAQEEAYKKKWGGDDITDASTMLQRVEHEKEALIADLKVKYGEKYFPLFFLDQNGTSIGRTGFHGGDRTNDISRSRYIRKMMIKILSVQLAIQKEKSETSNGCDCSGNNKKRHLQGTSRNVAEEDKNTATLIMEDVLPDFYQDFVWVNGGHSSAAGHGNIFNETYTAVMEASAGPAFQSVGIRLEGRNHAMGGMSSAPELALCNEAVYGLDADLLTWNFGMTDGNWWWRHSMYGNRIGVHRNRPLLLDIDAGVDNDDNNVRLRILKQLEEAGLPTLFMAVSFMYDHDSQDFIPDMQQMTQEQIDAVPEYLRYFKCGEGLEKGDPLCGDKKYTEKCSPHKAPWHPGWKANALMGNILALFMIEVLVDALKALQDVDAEQLDRKKMLKQLQRDEDEDYNMFMNSTLDSKNFPNEIWDDPDYEKLFRSPALCHTGLLPAEIRYRGILTESKNSSFDNYDYGTLRYDIDEEQKKDDAATPEKSVMPLVYNGKVDCPVPVAIDYKDYFYTSTKSGEATLAVPNNAEKKAYRPQNLHGLIIVCLVKCDWGKCNPGDMRPSDVAPNGNVTLSVNGGLVQEMTKLDDCTVLRGESGYVWKPNDKGEYDLAVKVNYPGGYLRISSVILV